MQSRESEVNRAAAALSWSSLLVTPHSLLTSHNRQDEHGWTKTEQNWLVCQKTSCCKQATEGKGAIGSKGKHAGDCQASPGAGVGELGLGHCPMDRDSTHRLI